MTHVVNDRWSTVRADDGVAVQVLTHELDAPPRGRLVWAHGGSWQRGGAAQWAPVTRRLAAASGWAVSSVDYRLAPQHPFPAAVHDVLAAVDQVAGAAPDAPLAVGGDSAGGTIAAASALVRRDRGERVPVQLLAYPPLDPTCSRPSYGPGDFPRPGELRRAWQLWLRHADPHTALRPSPLQVPDLSGLAPVALAVGDHDPVRDDVAEYARRLAADGVLVTHRVLPGVPHAELLRSSSRVLGALAEALNEYTDHERTTP
ncbi:hypothetical protein GCM10028784_21350 [Myceligenerans cantabricum]